MNEDTAIQFDTRRRIHLGIATRDLSPAIAFYSALLGIAPGKLRPGYARFESKDPPVILSLNQTEEETRPGNRIVHSGIQVKSTAAVQEVADRLANAGYELAAEEEVSCCYAVQNKIWVEDPDGNRWEVYVVIDDNGRTRHPVARDAAERPVARRNPVSGLPSAPGTPCCSPS